MDFEFDDEQLDLRDNARSVLAAACPPSLVRAVFEQRDTGDALWARLVELGWPALAVDEAHGGLGRTFVDLAVVVEELGRVVDPSPFLASVTQFVPFVAHATSPAAAERFLPAVADGSLTGALALAERGRWDPRATTTTASRDGAGYRLSGVKSHVLHAASADELAVVARAEGTSGDEGLGVFVVDAADVRIRPLTVLDPTMPLAEVTLDGVAVDADRVAVEPGHPAAADAIERAADEATAALALSTTATCRAMFETTVQYAKDRQQFGRPIGSFQALKHRLAEMYLSVERATSLCYFAAAAIAEDDPRRHMATAMAKAAAGDCQQLLVKDCLQLHGGIGYTWDYDLHFWLKRAKCAEPLFGSAAVHRSELAPMLGLAS